MMYIFTGVTVKQELWCIEFVVQTDVQQIGHYFSDL